MQKSAAMAAADPGTAKFVNQKSVSKFAAVVANAVNAINTFTKQAKSVKVKTLPCEQ